ncbi:unnamed protein product [Cochlearia groenlandica]
MLFFLSSSGGGPIDSGASKTDLMARSRKCGGRSASALYIRRLPLLLNYLIIRLSRRCLRCQGKLTWSDIPCFPALTRNKETWHLLNLETELGMMNFPLLRLQLQRLRILDKLRLLPKKLPYLIVRVPMIWLRVGHSIALCLSLVAYDYADDYTPTARQNESERYGIRFSQNCLTPGHHLKFKHKDLALPEHKHSEACSKDFHSTNGGYFCVCHVSNEFSLELSMLEPFPREKN